QATRAIATPPGADPHQPTSVLNTGTGPGGGTPPTAVYGQNTGGQTPPTAVYGQNTGGQTPPTAVYGQNTGGQTPPTAVYGQNTGGQTPPTAAMPPATPPTPPSRDAAYADLYRDSPAAERRRREQE